MDFQYLFNPLSRAWSGLFLVKLMTVNITTKLEDVTWVYLRFLLLLDFKKMFLTQLEYQKWELSSDKISRLGTVIIASDFRSRVCGSTCDVYHSSALIRYYLEGVKKIPRKLFPKRNFNKKELTLRAYMGDKGPE